MHSSFISVNDATKTDPHAYASPTSCLVQGASLVVGFAVPAVIFFIVAVAYGLKILYLITAKRIEVEVS